MISSSWTPGEVSCHQLLRMAPDQSHMSQLCLSKYSCSYQLSHTRSCPRNYQIFLNKFNSWEQKLVKWDWSNLTTGWGDHWLCWREELWCNQWSLVKRLKLYFSDSTQIFYQSETEARWWCSCHREETRPAPAPSPCLPDWRTPPCTWQSTPCEDSRSWWGEPRQQSEATNTSLWSCQS